MNLLKLTLLFLSVLTIMAAAIVAPAIPEIAKVFEGTPGADLLSKLVISIPTLFIALTAPAAGRYIDINGKLKLLYAGLIFYAISGSSGLYLDDIYHILIGRAVLGISIGIIMTITVTLIGDYFEGDERKNFIGQQTAFIGFAGIIFLSIGGVLADAGWRSPFLFYLLPLLILPLIIKFVSEPPKVARSPIDAPRQSNSLLRILYINALILMILFYIIPTQLPFFLHELGFNRGSLTGSALAINAFGMVISSLSYSRLKGFISFPYIYTIAFLLMSIGYFITGLSASLIIIFFAMFLAGSGIGLLMANTNLWVIELSGSEFRGENIGMLTTFLFLGQFLSPIVFEPLIRWSDLSFLFLFSSAIMAIISIFYLLTGKLLTGMGKA